MKLRSLLFVPADSAHKFTKASSCGADALILDLEDAVAPDAKDAARLQVFDAVKARGFGKREIIIRINGLSTPWGAEDLKAAVEAGKISP